MAKWQIRIKKNERSAPEPALSIKPSEERPANTTQSHTKTRAPEIELRLNRLRRRRELLAFDMEQAEAAVHPDNPWQARMALLTEAMDTVEADRLAIETQQIDPAPLVPPIPITGINVSVGELAMVDFTVGEEHFHYEEVIDWAERGTTVVRGDLRHQVGDAAKLIPATFSEEISKQFLSFLIDSLFSFAVDLRDRKLHGESLPATVTLADLASPCADCGGWTDWRGVCPACQQRNWHLQQLNGEARRLQEERMLEEEDRAKWAERFPVVRRRLAEVDAEIAALEN